MSHSPENSIRRFWIRWGYGLSVGVLCVLYFVGTLGVNSSRRLDFVALSAVNLTMTAAVVLLNAEGKAYPRCLAFTVCAVAGFVVEVIGVKTGYLFGVYTYSDRLGPRFLGVPWMIGVNWAVLVGCFQAIFSRVAVSRVTYAGLVATAMTAFDWVMEPAAIALGYWTWNGPSIPLQNYVAWWCTSAILVLVSDRIIPRPKNRVAPWVVALMLVFFSFAREVPR
jgi:putative membrane protein